MPDNYPSSFVILMADGRMLARDALNQSGATAVLKFVGDGVELLEYLHTAQVPDLLLLDLNMPRLDGRAALREIKSDPALHKLPVAVLTISGAPADIDASDASGANSYISKSVTFQGLLDTMRNLRTYSAETVQLPSK